LQALNYDHTKNLLLEWNPLVFENNIWTKPTDVKAIKESLTDLKKTLALTFKNDFDTGKIGFKRLSLYRR
jgi:hypothetical protein